MLEDHTAEETATYEAAVESQRVASTHENHAEADAT